MSDTSVQVFDNGIGGELRGGVNDDGSIWFAAADVAAALGYSSAKDLTRNLDDDEKGRQIVPTLGGNQELSTITEPGLYHSLNMRRAGSVKDEALRANVKAFQHQVNHEILPAIRRDGGYMVSKPDETPEETMARAVLIANETIKRQKADMERLEARNRALEPKAGFFDACMDGERWQSFTEVARLLHQYDRSMTRKRLFKLAYEDGLITHDKQASKLGIDRGYVRNYQPPAYFDQESGEQMRPKPYAKVTSKGVSWMFNRYCGRAE